MATFQKDESKFINKFVKECDDVSHKINRQRGIAAKKKSMQIIDQEENDLEKSKGEMQPRTLTQTQKNIIDNPMQYDALSLKVPESTASFSHFTIKQ